MSGKFGNQVCDQNETYSIKVKDLTQIPSIKSFKLTRINRRQHNFNPSFPRSTPQQSGGFRHTLRFAVVGGEIFLSSFSSYSIGFCDDPLSYLKLKAEAGKALFITCLLKACVGEDFNVLHV